MGKVKRSRERSILKGALAGVVGGIVGSGARVLAKRMSSPGIADGATLQMEPPLETIALPWAIGAIAGAAYGVAIEIEPKAGVWRGAGFGLALRKIAPEAPSPEAATFPMSVRQLTQQRQSQWISYAVFGVVTEAVRRLVRTRL
jgi:putative membrane protein